MSRQIFRPAREANAIRVIDQAKAVEWPKEVLEAVPSESLPALKETRLSVLRRRIERRWEQERDEGAKNLGAHILMAAEGVGLGFINKGVDPNIVFDAIMEGAGEGRMGGLYASIRGDLAKRAKWSSSGVLVRRTHGLAIEQCVLAEASRRMLTEVQQQAGASGKSLDRFLVEDMEMDPVGIKFHKRGPVSRTILGRRFFESNGIEVRPEYVESASD